VSVNGTGSSADALGQMLDKAFKKFDQNDDGKLDPSEFKKFNEILKPGIGVDENGKPSVDYSKTMDINSDGYITEDEMNSTTVVMPASLTSNSFGSLISYLKAEATPDSIDAASILSSDDPSTL
jgi:Ca2+-binding EF-hand superfamily protein